MSLFTDTRVKVKPVVFFPKGEFADVGWASLWLKHLKAARRKYRAMLKKRDTFRLDELAVVTGQLTAKQYYGLRYRTGEPGYSEKNRLRKHYGGQTILCETLRCLNLSAFHDRYTLPYVIAVLMVDTTGDWSYPGGGTCLNGGLDRGGGFVIIPHRAHTGGTLQSTVLHELGHCFGLVHCWHRGSNFKNSKEPKEHRLYRCFYGKYTSPSVMSYNKRNHTNSTKLADIPGCLLGDEIDALSRNRFVFSKLVFDPASDFDCKPTESGCGAHDRVSRERHLGPWDLAWCYTRHGAKLGSRITNLNDNSRRQIREDSPELGFDKTTMWHSGPVNSKGWVAVEVTFPVEVTLDQIRVYSRHSGKHHPAKAVQVEAQHASGGFTFVNRAYASSADAEVCFAATTARIWKLAFKGDKYVVIRGLRFFLGAYEIFPPPHPTARTTHGERYGSRVANLVEIQRRIGANTKEVGFDQRTMWHSGRVNSKGWVAFDVAFPTAVSLDRLLVYSEYSRKHHRAYRVQIAAREGWGPLEFVHAEKLTNPNAAVIFPPRQAKFWRFAFKGSPKGYVVLRGMRFFHEDLELFPPSVVE